MVCATPRSKKKGKCFSDKYAAEPSQVFTQQSSQSLATALLAFKCGAEVECSLFLDPEGRDTLQTVHQVYRWVLLVLLRFLLNYLLLQLTMLIVIFTVDLGKKQVLGFFSFCLVDKPKSESKYQPSPQPLRIKSKMFIVRHVRFYIGHHHIETSVS